ncbi:MAG TPA: FecR domain-containing protein [Steroidobacteraceae bacterium]
MRAQTEAAAWIAVLHSSERSAEVEAGLKRWIAADPLHANVWEVATDVWTDTANLPRRIPQPRARARNRFMRPLLAIAVLCLVVAGITLPGLLPMRISTGVGEQRNLSLQDGTRVELNTNTQLLVRFDHHARTVTLESGEAYFQVAHELRPFNVVAGERRIQALGTAFTVRRDKTTDEAVTVTLIEGRVTVDTNAASPASRAAEMRLLLNPGQRLRLHGHAAPTLDSPSMEKTTAWMQGQLTFDHTPLREAVDELNRYSTFKIRVASALVGSIPIGGIFGISDSRSFAHAVADTYDLRLVQRQSEILLDSKDAGEPPSPSDR